MISLLFLLLLSLLLPACGKEISKPSYYYSFSDSVAIIRALLKKDSLPKILEDADPEGLERLIDNFSPAQMALESEVLNCTLPVLLYFYEEPLENAKLLDQLAQEYNDRVKIVTIDADKFFSITQLFEVEKFPTIIGMHKREELSRSENDSFREELEWLSSVNTLKA